MNLNVKNNSDFELMDNDEHVDPRGTVVFCEFPSRTGSQESMGTQVPGLRWHDSCTEFRFWEHMVFRCFLWHFPQDSAVIGGRSASAHTRDRRWLSLRITYTQVHPTATDLLCSCGYSIPASMHRDRCWL